jgi:isoleucyl-tRNA synthetase
MDQNGLRQAAHKAINGTTWMPDWGQKRIEGMVEGRPDWCISRQRTWGVPIPLFVHQQTGELHPNTQALMEQVATQVEQQGIEAWFDLEAASLLGDEAGDYDKVSDTLDVWFDSGVSHACVLARRGYLNRPADLYLEGSDQHRGWFQSSLLTSVASTGKAPYKAVLTHGFTVDANGMKMSKSKGNVIAPQKVVNNLGADIIRLWVASADYTSEMNVSDDILKQTADSYRRIRNTARYLLSNLSDFNPVTDSVAVEDMLALDQWAVDRAYHVQQDILAAYEGYQFQTIYQKMHNFCANEMGSLYLDITKDRQYTMPENSVGRRSTQTAMYHILEALTRWIAPILSFTADELWQHLPGERNESVMLNTWYDQLAPLPTTATLDLPFWEQVFNVRDVVSKAIEEKRNTGLVKGGLTTEVVIHAGEQAYKPLQLLGDELKFVLITSKVSLLQNTTSDSALEIDVSASEHARCDRCWHQVEEVGKNETHPELCDRCINNIDGEGEQRHYA